MNLEGLQIDRYIFKRLIGHGGMGEVYLAEDTTIQRPVAIKVVRTEVSPYPHADSAKRSTDLSVREMKAISKLDHPHILALFDYGEKAIHGDMLSYMVMPYREEGSLANWLRQRGGLELLSAADVVFFIRQAGDALQHAHDHNIIHQDVKPSNFLIRSRANAPDYPDLLLADFGIAKFISATSSTSQNVRGTPTYMAPEQWEGKPVPATDQYALAVMTYELLTGQAPFQGGMGQMMYQHLNVVPPAPSTVKQGISPALDSVLLHALAKKPIERFPSVASFVSALEQAIQGIAPIISEIKTARISDLQKKVDQLGTMPLDAPDGLVRTLTAQRQEEDIATALSSHRENSATLPSAKRNATSDTFQQGSHSESTSAQLTGRARHFPFVGLLLLLVVLIIGSTIFFSVNSAARVKLSSLFGFAPATIVVTPASQTIQDSYQLTAVTGAPDVSQHQVGLRQISFTTPDQTEHVTGTGQKQTAGTSATGTLNLLNITGRAITVEAGTQFTASNGVVMITDQTVTIRNIPGPDQGTVSAHAASPGAQGNIPANTISIVSGSMGLSISNEAAFSGGQDPQTYTYIQQSDVDSVFNGAKDQLLNAAQAGVRQQVKTNEAVIDAIQCSDPRSNIDQHVGSDIGDNSITSANLILSQTCSALAYDKAGAQNIVKDQLQAKAKAVLGDGYALVGKIQSTASSKQSGNNNQLPLQINAQGIYSYQFSSDQKQNLLQAIAGKSVADAQRILKGYKGVDSAKIETSATSLPGDLSQLTLSLHKVPDLS